MHYQSSEYISSSGGAGEVDRQGRLAAVATESCAAAGRVRCGSAYGWARYQLLYIGEDLVAKEFLTFNRPDI